MKPTEVLHQEHEVIEQVLNCLDAMVQRARLGEKLDKESAREAIEFFRGFAEHCHHGKEEAHLFPALAAKGFSGECGPLAVLLREHELGRLYVRGMEAALDAAAAGDREAFRWFAEHAQSYDRLLREHIHKEDHCLFPSSDRVLDEVDQGNLLAAFHRVEMEEMGPGTHEKFVQLADRLADRLGVPRATAEMTEHHCCGH